MDLNTRIFLAVGEIRPCNALQHILVLHCNSDPGFPSDHAAMAGAATAGLWLLTIVVRSPLRLFIAPSPN